MTDSADLAPPAAPRLAATIRGFVVRAARPAAFLAVGVILVLSLVPGGMRPHTGATGNLEHAVAYALTALVAGIAWRGVLGWRGPVAFTILAGLLEVAQIFVPGRSAGVDNWAASTCGAVIGIAVASALRARFGRASAAAPARRD
jgi:hypothetical protein